MGYVGIPCAALLADVPGHAVVGLEKGSDRSSWKIDTLNAGLSPIEGDEPGLAELLERVVKKGTFRATGDYEALRDRDTILICVQTPTDGDNHRPRYLALKEAVAGIGENLKKGAIVITESTLAPGTTEHVIKPIIERASGLKAGRDFSLAYSYERLMPGRLIRYIQELPRIVGGIDAESEQRARELYATIVKAPIHTTGVMTAEATKTIENAYRDVNIAFSNEMALVCESLGIDIYEVQRLINTRSERMMHYPGAGVGGHCLPKDTWLLLHGLSMYGKHEVKTHFVELARTINESMPIHVFRLLEDALRQKGRTFPDVRVALLGVAYLENSDDTRNTPAYTLIDQLAAYGADIIAHDPYVTIFPEARLTHDLQEAVKNADALVIMTKHSQYGGIDLARTAKAMRTPIIIDGRDTFNPRDAEAAGFFYRAIGKGTA